MHITDQQVVCKGWEVRGGGFSVKRPGDQSRLCPHCLCGIRTPKAVRQVSPPAPGPRGRGGGVTTDTSSALHLRVTRTVGIPGGQQQVEAAEGRGERWWEVVPSQEETLASDPRR